MVMVVVMVVLMRFMDVVYSVIFYLSVRYAYIG